MGLNAGADSPRRLLRRKGLDLSGQEPQQVGQVLSGGDRQNDAVIGRVEVGVIRAAGVDAEFEAMTREEPHAMVDPPPPPGGGFISGR
jgi:hypothetical protein